MLLQWVALKYNDFKSVQEFYKLTQAFKEKFQIWNNFQFCFLHAFFWMNILSYEIFCRFTESGRRNIGQGNDNHRRRKKLISFASYAIGASLVFSSITLILEFGVDPAKIASGFKPNMGKRSCFFDRDSKPVAFVLFYLPLLLIQVRTIFSNRPIWASFSVYFCPFNIRIQLIRHSLS